MSKPKFLTMKGILKRFSALLLSLLLIKEVSAQVDCVNYDSRYPITTSTGKVYKWNPLWNFSPMKMKKFSGLNIGGDNYFNGMLQYVPSSYYLTANATKKYPVIISFHGYAAKGFGSALELCRLFKDRGGDSAGHKTFPGRVERSTSNLTQYWNGVTYEYIVVAPQFNKYVRLQPGVTDAFPTAKQVENVINYVVARFRIDPKRIYLTGYSNGANMIIEYVASSVARAQRVAAIMPVSLCSQLGHVTNTSRGYFAKNIGLAKLKTWFVYCEGDNCGSGPILNVPNKWVDSIMKVPGAVRPRYTRLRNINPATLYNCSDSLLHDAWSRAFDPNFRVSNYYTPTGAVGANDGINLNMYQWFIRQTNTATSLASELDPTILAVEVERSSIVVSPNPFISEVTAHLSLDKPQRVQINLTDVTGRLIQSVKGVYGQGSSEVRLNLSTAPAGVYVIKVAGENFTSTHKIVKR
jgi:predicted esterase